MVRPHLGKHKVAAVSYADVQDLHRLITKHHGPYAANRLVSQLSRMFNLAVRWGWRSDNPARGIERNAEHKREHYITPEELPRLIAALAADRDQQAANAFRMLLLTGARKSEVLGMRWDQINLTTGVWIKPHAATKQKKEHRTPLSAPVVALLNRIERGESKYVFPGRYNRGRRVKVSEAWKRILLAAKISDMRIHDIRHSNASILASAGFSLPMIGAMLGHTSPATTARYVHLFDDPLRLAAEKVGAIVEGNGS